MKHIKKYTVFSKVLPEAEVLYWQNTTTTTTTTNTTVPGTHFFFFFFFLLLPCRPTTYALCFPGVVRSSSK